MSGFYLMHRGWQDNPVFRNEAFSRRDAFLWLIEAATYRTVRVHAGAGEITLERGQLSHSLRFMAKAWQWDEAKVRRFLSSLSRAKMIDAHTDAGQTVVTVCNYDKYQAPERVTDAASDAATTQQRRGDDAKKKEGNKGKEEIDDGGAQTLEIAVPDFPTDLIAITSEVCRMAGIRHVDPGHVLRHQQTVQGWLTDGFDVGTDIVPAVRQAIADATERIGSLSYFDRSIRQHRARREAQTDGFQPRNSNSRRAPGGPDAMALALGKIGVGDLEARAAR